MRRRLAALLAGAAGLVVTGAVADTPATGGELRALADFDTIGDPRARSAAMFVEAGKVLQHPRCLNCHPVSRQPTQGEDLHAHQPPIHGGSHDHGVAGLPCDTCHGAANVPTLGHPIRSVPGSSHWGLAPVSMAWQGQSLAEICNQIKDPARNGGRSLAQIGEHMGRDPLVGWAWQPGEGRVPAPGTQQQFASLIEAWIATGGHCPEESP